MSFWDLVEKAAQVADQARSVKEAAEDVAGVAANAYENVRTVEKLHDDLSKRAREGKKTSTLGLVFEVGRRVLR